MRLVVCCFFCSLLLLFSCTPSYDRLTEQGVSWELAEHRKETLSNIRYEVSLSIPAAQEDPILGNVTLSFDLEEGGNPVIIDFNQPADQVLAVQSGEKDLDFEVVNNHVVIKELSEGPQSVKIRFQAGERSLNRNPEYLYTLFVPDRASFSIPLFDQPNLKARYQLNLTIPSDWKAVANGELANEAAAGQQVTHTFKETDPISTYLFAFAAGKFQTETAERGGRKMTMYHRETDTEKVARNREAIFDLHYTALSWLENYTEIDYPFGKFDFVLIPSFQYGGMEHPGSILYRQASLMLDESATQSQYLGRASLIAHETAHMWFGDLVTMNWFDDVWTKEVFANFMAAKIVNPTFPEINHELRFLLSHYPAAYDIDRTAGANPIRQPLENLQMAGTLYGAIIYQKAPIVMKHLERLVGEDLFRDGLRVYLDEFRYSNATWNDLITILDAATEEDLRHWSSTWVDEPGRPHIKTHVAYDAHDQITSLTLEQSHPVFEGRIWPQQLDLTLAYPDSLQNITVFLDDETVEVSEVIGQPKPAFILPDGLGIGYGRFELDEASRTYLVDRVTALRDPVLRGVAWITLWDEMLDGQLEPATFFELCLRGIAEETDELNLQRILSYLPVIYWRFLPIIDRAAYAGTLENKIWALMQSAPSPSRKASYFNAYKSVVLSSQGYHTLRAVWDKAEQIPGLTFSEDDYTTMALELAVRDRSHNAEILEQQAARITNPDRLARFEFVQAALSPHQKDRDAFFSSLKNVENRSHEPWVLEALRYLHHPLVAETSINYLLPGLDLLEEIQQTGDIFFPQRWLAATLDGHRSEEAAEIVQTFLDTHPQYPNRLKNKILQSADALFRASAIAQ